MRIMMHRFHRFIGVVRGQPSAISGQQNPISPGFSQNSDRLLARARAISDFGRGVDGKAQRRLLIAERLLGVFIPIFAVFALVLLSLGGCGGKADEQSVVRPVAIRVTNPVFADMENQVAYMGTVYAQRVVRVIAQVQGTIIALPFREGEQVKQGDVVARLDAPELRAAVQRQGVEVDYWLRHYESDQRLAAVGAVPEEQLESSKRASASARAALQEGKARLAKTLEKSPLDGQVLKWYAEPGQSVMPGQAMALLGDDRLEIQVEVVEEDLRRGIAPGMVAEIEDGWGNRVHVPVSEVAPLASGVARVFLVRLPFENAHPLILRKGASVRVQFILSSSSGALSVPLSAISDRDGMPHIFLIRDQKAFRQSVTLGIEKKGWIEASFSWNGEDRVAISNVGRLQDGASVFPVFVEVARP